MVCVRIALVLVLCSLVWADDGRSKSEMRWEFGDPKDKTWKAHRAEKMRRPTFKEDVDWSQSGGRRVTQIRLRELRQHYSTQKEKLGGHPKNS